MYAELLFKGTSSTLIDLAVKAQPILTDGQKDLPQPIKTYFSNATKAIKIWGMAT
jgi:hypothetical protein